MRKTAFVLTLITFILAFVLLTPVLAFAESAELSAVKESAIFQLESFLENEAYAEASKNVQREMEKIIDEAILKIHEAETAEEVNQIKVDALNDLANVDIGGNDWKKMLAVGILLAVLLVVAVVGVVIKKKRELGKRTAQEDDDEDELLSTVEEVTFKKDDSEHSEMTNKLESETSQTTEDLQDEAKTNGENQNTEGARKK